MTSSSIKNQKDVESSAQFSECRRYRYQLWRKWSDGGYAMFIGLNPSTADETINDRTICRCMTFAKDWGYGALLMTNLFAFRATDPKVMKREAEPVGPANDQWLMDSAASASVIVAAWGADGIYRNRAQAVRAIVKPLHYLRLTKDGHPGHPLYLPKTLTPLEWL